MPWVDSKKVSRNVDINIAGHSAWKELLVSDSATGEIIVEKKFYKADFGTMMKDPTYKPFIDKVIDCAYSSNAMISDEQEEVYTDDGGEN
jgi:hypothetical protein